MKKLVLLLIVIAVAYGGYIAYDTFIVKKINYKTERMGNATFSVVTDWERTELKNGNFEYASDKDHITMKLVTGSVSLPSTLDAYVISAKSAFNTGGTMLTNALAGVNNVQVSSNAVFSEEKSFMLFTREAYTFKVVYDTQIGEDIISYTDVVYMTQLGTSVMFWEFSVPTENYDDQKKIIEYIYDTIDIN